MSTGKETVSALVLESLPEELSWVGRPQEAELSGLPGRPAVYLLTAPSQVAVQFATTQHLRRLAADLGLAGRVVFTGQVADTRPALAAMDLFVHPGDPEPFGLVNLGAMAMGKPVVAFAHGALPEIVADGETGLLVLPGDEAALAGVMIALLGDPIQRRAMGQMGRKRVEVHFTAARMAKEVDATLWEVVQ